MTVESYLRSALPSDSSSLFHRLTILSLTSLSHNRRRDHLPLVCLGGRQVGSLSSSLDAKKLACLETRWMARSVVLVCNQIAVKKYTEDRIIRDRSLIPPDRVVIKVGVAATLLLGTGKWSTYGLQTATVSLC